ncbi:MAG: beta-galactosidase, partial [Clostridiales bacterium]|nr:beta-galactosidase [Clostridiales bacterium]
INAEFDRFRRSVAADYLNWQSKIVSEYKRGDQFITHNFDFNWDVDKLSDKQQTDPYSHGMQQRVNHYESSGAVTLAGCDIYHPSQDALTGAEIAYGGDEIRMLKNAPYLVLETETQGFKSWTPYPGQLRLQAYSHLASGACGVMY